MAEKEEIIFIDLIEGGCAKCPHEYGSCERCYYRQEAIEKMAKAINEAYLNRNKDYIFHFGLLAEAALNALLGDK